MEPTLFMQVKSQEKIESCTKGPVVSVHTDHKTSPVYR
jgi:hypothetical protein